MSSQGRSRSYEMGRPKEDLLSYRDSPYPSKSRTDMDSRKRETYSSRGGSRGMGEKHREPYPKPSRRSMEDHKDPYMSSGDKRDPASYKRGREREREEYSRGGRERDYSMDSRDDDSFHSRGGRDSFHSRGGRDSFHSRGGRDSFHSRGGRDSYHPRGRGSFLSRGSRDSMSRGSYGSRGGRDSFSSRGSYISGRGGRPSFSRGTYGSRGGREPFPIRGSRGSSRGFRGSSYRGTKSDNFGVSHLGPRAHMELTKKLVASVLEESDGRGHFDDERPYRSKEFRREGRGFYHRDSDRHFKEPPRSFSHHTPPYIDEDKMIKRERSTSGSHFDKEKFRYSERSRKDKFRGPPPKRIHDDDGDFDLEEEPPVKQPRLNRRGRGRDSHFDDFDRRPSRSYSPPPRSTSREERPPPRKTSKEDERVKRKGDREGVVKVKTEEERPKAVEKRRPRKVGGVEDDEGEDRPLKEAVKQELVEEEDNEAKTSMTDEDDRDQDLDEDRRSSSSRLKANRKFSREAEEEEEEEEEDDDEKYDSRRRHRGRGGDSSPSGMQVTIRSDGERAVNREGRVKSRIAGGKIFVDLQCPHCPTQMGQSAIVTFKEYRYHLDSRTHRARFDKLAFKHSIVLRRIRLQQRNEQREVEEKWEEENPEEFSTTVSRFCKFCKLAFKCLPVDGSAKGIADHNESKLHKVQQRYLYPRCTTCRMSFPSRLVYEYHIASIRHLRMRTFSMEGYAENESKDEGSRSEREEVDLTNFITMDSVGEDEEVGSEHEEITGKLEDIEKAEEDAKEGDEDEDESVEEGKLRSEPGASSPLGPEEREDPFEVDLEEEPLDHEVEDMPDPADEENHICGKEYVVPMEAFYCKLCRKAIRIDTDIGEEAIHRHCRSSQHMEEYNYLGTEEFLEEHGDHFDEEHLQEGREEVEDEVDPTFDREERRSPELELEDEIAEENGEGDDDEWKRNEEPDGPSDDDEGAVEADGKAAKREKKVNGN